MSLLIEDRGVLAQKITGSGEALVLFYASWCQFSKAFLPVYEKHACGEGCYRVLADEVAGTEDTYEIEFFPTVILFKKGRLYARLDGIPGQGLREDMLLDFIQSCKECRPRAGRKENHEENPH